MHRFFGTLFKVIAAIHETFKEDTVSNSEHVSNFVSHDRDRTIFDQIIVYLIFFRFEEFLIIASE